MSETDIENQPGYQYEPICDAQDGPCLVMIMVLSFLAGSASMVILMIWLGF